MDTKRDESSSEPITKRRRLTKSREDQTIASVPAGNREALGRVTHSSKAKQGSALRDEANDGSGRIQDEFQQVTKPDFVKRYRLDELGYGGDVYYQSDVR